MLYVDSHLDLAFNSLSFGRDYRLPLSAIREAERSSGVDVEAGVGTVAIPDLLEAGVGLICATVFTMPVSARRGSELAYPTKEAARTHALAQLDLYERWISEDRRLIAIRDRGSLEALQRRWSENRCDTVGIIYLMENAEPVESPRDLEEWWMRGVRVIGPAWRANRYTGSTAEGGPLTSLGHELLKGMAEIGFVLDLSHMSESGCSEALESYRGDVIASHANPRRVADIPRMLSDETVRGIGDRGGVVGLMPVNWALGRPDSSGEKRAEVSLTRFVDAVRATTELGCSLSNIGLGTDWDGGFGREQLPGALDSGRDLGKIAEALTEGGFSPSQVSGVMGGNWITFFSEALPR